MKKDLKPLAQDFNFTSIGVVESLFKDKFGIPRQPGLAQNVKGLIQLNKDEDLKRSLRRLEEFSHIWVIFVFHAHGGKKWKPSIRPPRLGGSEKVGVLASRSPHRPNPIGLSVVKLNKINLDAKEGPQLEISGHDFLDGTPVLDIKPYIPYADIVSSANSGWASEPIKKIPVIFKKDLDKSILTSEFKNTVTEILELDPRPAFQKKNTRQIHMKAGVGSMDLRF